MLIISLAHWWYGAGWKKLAQVMIQKLALTEDFFSIDLLLATLVAPFRQISADSPVNGSLQMKFQAMFDKLFSRFIGLVVRSLLILVGGMWIVAQALVDIVILAFWPIVPFLPLIGLILAINGWVPWTT